jgi:hypothetical protein
MVMPGVLLIAAMCVAADDNGMPPDAATASAAPCRGVVSGAMPAAIVDMAAPASIDENPKLVWGVLDGKLFPDARRVAPNGEPYNPIFSLDANINIWLWPGAGLYAFTESRFWGQRGTPDQTHGNFDYTKREFDLTGGAAWNYYGFLELRIFGYAYNNLNRGISPILPEGYDDGFGIEQRLYLGSEYALVGTDGFNVSRATFVSLGYYPSKTMTGFDGSPFTPGLFARAYLTWDIAFTCAYMFGDIQLICAQSMQPRLLVSDAGVAIVPFEHLRMFELRLGSEFQTGFGGGAVRNNSLPLHIGTVELLNPSGKQYGRDP